LLSNKFGFILETSHFSYWWTAKSLDDAPCTSLKETKLKPSYKAKEKFVKFKTNKEEQYKVIQNFQVPQKEQSNCCKFSSAILTKKKKKIIN
jgi:hypothetical protein